MILVFFNGKDLSFNELYIRPEDRIGITGGNGCGKSTLIRHMVAAMGPDENGICYLPQEIDLAEAVEKIAAIKKLPNERLGKIMILISRLGSRPDRLLETKRPSPGEIRKILLAEGMSRHPHIIVMDEPTNHLDLPSVEALEDALLECPSALLLVSHDLKFIEAVTRKRWGISPAAPPKRGVCEKECFVLDEHLD